MLKISLAAARVNAKLTQKEVCDKLNISKATLVKWESGKTIPDFVKVQKLCEIYKIGIENIFLPERFT